MMHGLAGHVKWAVLLQTYYKAIAGYCPLSPSHPLAPNTQGLSHFILVSNAKFLTHTHTHTHTHTRFLSKGKCQNSNDSWALLFVDPHYEFMVLSFLLTKIYVQLPSQCCGPFLVICRWAQNWKFQPPDGHLLCCWRWWFVYLFQILYCK